MGITFLILILIMAFSKLKISKDEKIVAYSIICLQFIIVLAGVVIIEPIIYPEAKELANITGDETIINDWSIGHALNYYGYKTNIKAMPTEESRNIAKAVVSEDERHLLSALNHSNATFLFLSKRGYERWLSMADNFGIEVEENNLYEKVTKNKTLIYTNIYGSIYSEKDDYYIIGGKEWTYTNGNN